MYDKLCLQTIFVVVYLRQFTRKLIICNLFNCITKKDELFYIQEAKR